ncbi:STAS domain-containing protein [Streptomyces sp. NPDC060188]|uniref:STAS domain-containing protein n=1 Tax=Streptomyces sp. NPDC060188 TaxID=3347068 RepID=UPI00365D28CC
MTDLTITTRTAAAGPVIEVCGDLDYATVPGFRETVIGLSLVQGDLLTVDLAGLSYCDSTGLTALVCAHDLALERGAGMVLAAVSDDLARILSITGLGQFFSVRQDSQPSVSRSAAS